MATKTASARRARKNLAVRVYDMATGALLRVTTTRGEIARGVAKYDALHASGAMTDKAHRNALATLRTMERCAFGADDRTADEVNADEETARLTAWTERVRSHRDYDGAWSGDEVANLLA